MSSLAAGRAARALVAVSLAAIAAACAPQGSPSPVPEPPDVATPAGTPRYADTLRIGFVPGAVERGYNTFVGFRQVSGEVLRGLVIPQGVVHAALYRSDARHDVVPDLADGPCEPREDGVVIRCRLVEASFHDATPVTAGDVAYVYEVFLRPAFFNTEITGRLRNVRIVDSRTIDFELTERDPTFLTETLRAVPIIPRHAVEASFAAFSDATRDLDPDELTGLAGAIADELVRSPRVCTPRVEEVAALLERIGVTLYRADFVKAGGDVFDPCAYMSAAARFIRRAAESLDLEGLDAVAAAWQLLSIDWRPVGAGPYRFLSEDASGIRFEAWPGYHGDRAATRFVDFVPTTPDGSGVVEGSIDILQRVALDAQSRAAASSLGIRAVAQPQPGFMALYFNVRPGRLFADRALRRALQLCVDMDRDVDAATAGIGAPIYGPVPSGTWAYEPDLPKPVRDVAAARALIEGAGWQAGADGVYSKAGVRLAADILVRSSVQERVKMSDLIAKDARSCGMDLRSRPLEFTDLLAMIGRYPHAIPGTGRPFDAYIGGLSTTVDPGGIGLFVSSAVTDADHPEGENYMGFTDPVVDRLSATAMATYDQAERTRLYREVQRELAAQLPVLFLWANDLDDVVSPAVATADGPLDLEAGFWGWQPERLVVIAP